MLIDSTSEERSAQSQAKKHFRLPTTVHAGIEEARNTSLNRALRE